MSSDVATQSEFSVFLEEFKAYIGKLMTEWLSKNRVISRDVYEVMNSEERAKVHQRIAEWSKYVTPLAEAWWKERGYGIVWPADNSQPMQVHKL